MIEPDFKYIFIGVISKENFTSEGDYNKLFSLLALVVL